MTSRIPFSRHARSLTSALACALALTTAFACGDDTNNAASELNLDRPTDLAFACYGGLRITNGGSANISQPVELSAQPITACDIRSGAHDATVPAPVPVGQEDLTAQGGAIVNLAQYYVFILQSVAGTVAIANFDTKPNTAFAGNDVTVLDADPLTPGKNAFSVGEMPIAIATDKAGCYEVTANSGSCDLSELEISSALDTDPAVRVDRVDVRSSTGNLVRAKPAAMVAEPVSAPIGQECPSTATGLMYVAYPSCHLVAAVDVSSGAVVGGISYDASGVPSLLPDGNVSCPDECGGGASGVVDGVRPVTLDLELDPRVSSRRLIIGADNSSAITIVELGADSLPVSLSQLAFSDPKGTLGITQVALTPQIGMGGQSGQVDDTTGVGGQAQYVYAIATDQTIRVADVLNLRKECDTQVDPRYLHDVRNVKQLSCLPVGDPATPPRRAGVTSPGITLTANAVPTSVAIIRGDTYAGDTRLQAPGTLIGYFAIVTAATGVTYVVNINDDFFPDDVDPAAPIATQIPLDIAHQLRDALPDRGELANTTVESASGSSVTAPICDTDGPDPDATAGNQGGARVAAAPSREVPIGFIDPTKVNNLPSIHQVLCTGTDEPLGKPVSELGFAAPVAVRDAAFPDLHGLRNDEVWTLSWEGSLSLDSIATANNGPSIRTSQMFVDSNGMRLQDQTAPFCAAGVQAQDIVQLDGCDPSLGDLDCPEGYTCFVHPDSQVVDLGACMLDDEASRLADSCKEFLTSLRRYTVGTSAAGTLVLLPRRHELGTSPVDGCTSSAQCQTLANYAQQNLGNANPIDDKTPPDKHAWTCDVDPYREPAIDRCMETCTVDTDCDTGTVCQGGFCMEGVEPPQSCVNAPQRYDLRAGSAFTVVGALSGYVHPIIEDPATGACVVDPAADPLQVGRIPLTAPPCAGSGITDFSPNPCSITVTQSELEPQFGPNCANLGTTLGSRTTTGIRFSNHGMTFTIVDPTYPGDLTCTGDRMGTLGNIPLVFSGYQLTFRQTAGLTPMQLPITPAYPVKTVRGPGESIWVIDDGDFLSTDVTVASTKGQVFRVESVDISILSELQ